MTPVIDAICQFLTQARTRGIQLAVRRGAITSNVLTEQLRRTLLRGVVPERIRDDDNRIANPSDAAAAALALELLSEALERGKSATDVVATSSIFGDGVAVALAEVFVSVDRLTHTLRTLVDRDQPMPRYQYRKEASRQEKDLTQFAQTLESEQAGEENLILEAPPLEAPPLEAPPLETPPLEAPPLEAPPLEAPPLEVPPLETPPLEAPAPESTQLLAPSPPPPPDPYTVEFIHPKKIIAEPVHTNKSLELIARLPANTPPALIETLKRKAARDL